MTTDTMPADSLSTAFNQIGVAIADLGTLRCALYNHNDLEEFADDLALTVQYIGNRLNETANAIEKVEFQLRKNATDSA